MKKVGNRKAHCITLTEEASRQLEEGAMRLYLPKNIYIEKLLREEEERRRNALSKDKN